MRLGELRFDTDLDVAHAVTRYLELLKVAALIQRPPGQTVAEALPDISARLLAAATAQQREIFDTSALDDYLIAAERDARRRAKAMAARDEPSLAPFLPRRGDGLALSASDIETYLACPLRYKFARVLRIPQEPTVNQRFGIVVHQVLERFHTQPPPTPPSEPAHPPRLDHLLGLLDGAWRRGGMGDSEQERQLRMKATTALTRYHERVLAEDAEPVWFERAFTFGVGRHRLRGRVDRVDNLGDGRFELIDYKTGRPKTPAQVETDVQLAVYALGAREAWQLDSTEQAYLYVLDDVKVPLAPGAADEDWISDTVTEVAAGIESQGFEPTPSPTVCGMCDYRLDVPRG